MSEEVKKELTRLKRLRSAKQGQLTRHVNYFQSQVGAMDSAAFANLLTQIDELHKKFEEIEEHIVMIDPTFDDLHSDDEIPTSNAAKKFEDDYSGLRVQILAVVDAGRLKEEEERRGTGSKCRLPELQLPHFDGEITKWTDFRNEFVSLTLDTNLTNVDRFRLLKSALGEGPRQVISNIEITEANFQPAWDALIRRYENKGMIFRAHINSIFSLQGVSEGDIEGHRRLLDKSQAHYRAMLQMGTFENVADNLLISYLLTKLDMKCQQEWEDHTDEDVSSWEDFTRFFEKYTSTMEKIEQTRRQIQQTSKSSSTQPSVGKQHENLATAGMNKCYKCHHIGPIPYKICERHTALLKKKLLYNTRLLFYKTSVMR